MLGLGERIAEAFGSIRWLWCVLTWSHRIELRGRDEDETLHYRCTRCGQVWPYYF